MKKCFSLLLVLALVLNVKAQDNEEKEGGFRKENLFTGGNLSLSFFNNTFLIGGSPVLGYRLANFVDAGIVANIQYTSMRDYRGFDDRLRQTTYGGGLFTRLYPVNFIFAQAQFEHNFITQKYIPGNNSSIAGYKLSTSANSMLVGGGYCSGRARDYNSPFFYMSVLWDISGNANSPYTDAYGRSVPIIRAGVNIPLFQRGSGF